MRLLNLKPRGSRSQRPDPTKLSAWNPAGRGDLRVLKLLWRYGYLTREMAEYAVASGVGGTGGHVRNRLTRLWRYGFVSRFYRATPPGGGSSQFVYTLTREGAKYILSEEHFRSSTKAPMTPTELRLKNLNKRKVNYEHTLATILWRLVWDLGIRKVPEVEHRAYWIDKEGDGSGEPRTSKNRFSVVVEGRKVTLYPDATVWLAWRPTEAHSGYYQPLFIEIERSHRNAIRSRERFLAYEALVTHAHHHVVDVCQRHVDARIVPAPGMVLFVGLDNDHRDRLRAAARQVISKNNLAMIFSSLTELFEDGHQAEQLLSDPTRLFRSPIGVHFKGANDHGNPWSIVPQPAS